MEDNKSEENVALWSIDDDTLFHPLGLKNLGSEAKTVILTWNEDYLLNFVIKKSKNTTIKKVRIPLPECEIVKSLLVLDLNTLCLMESGEVYYFSSAKSVHKIAWLDRVYAISAAAPVGFSVLRLMDIDKSLHLVLEIYSDVADLNINEETAVPLVETFQIPNVELDLFHNLWSDEKFILLSIAVNENQLNFLIQMIGCEKNDLFANQILHFFSISSSLYVFIPNPDAEQGFTIRLLARYASEIEAIKIMPNIQLCVFVLNCGTIDIWYLTPASCVMKRLKHNIDAEYLAFDFALESDAPSFYYTTDDYVLQLKLVYNANLDLLTILDDRKAVPGIVACTWVPSIQQLVCLNFNNIFYQIAFNAEDAKQQTVEEEKVLKNFNLADLKVKSNALTKITHECNILQNALEAENTKRQLLAATKNSANSQYLTLSMKFVHKEEGKYISLKFVQNSASFFMSIDKPWILHIVLNEHIFIYDATHFFKETCIILPIYANGVMQSLFFPIIKIRLLNFIVDGDNYTCLELPVKILHEYSNELCRLPKCINNLHKFENLLNNYKKNQNMEESHQFLFQNECFITSYAFEQLKCLFVDIKEVDSGIFQLKAEKLTASYVKSSKKLTLSSSSALELFTLNMFLLNLLKISMDCQMTECNKISLDSSDLLQNAQKYMSKLELLSADRMKQPIETAHSRMQYEILLEIYHKLRTNLQLFKVEL